MVFSLGGALGKRLHNAEVARRQRQGYESAGGTRPYGFDNFDDNPERPEGAEEENQMTIKMTPSESEAGDKIMESAVAEALVQTQQSTLSVPEKMLEHRKAELEALQANHKHYAEQEADMKRLGSETKLGLDACKASIKILEEGIAANGNGKGSKKEGGGA